MAFSFRVRCPICLTNLQNTEIKRSPVAPKGESEERFPVYSYRARSPRQSAAAGLVRGPQMFVLFLSRLVAVHNGSALLPVTLRLCATRGFPPTRAGLRSATRPCARPRSSPSALRITAQRFFLSRFACAQRGSKPLRLHKPACGPSKPPVRLFRSAS